MDYQQYFQSTICWESRCLRCLSFSLPGIWNVRRSLSQDLGTTIVKMSHNTFGIKPLTRTAHICFRWKLPVTWNRLGARVALQKWFTTQRWGALVFNLQLFILFAWTVFAALLTFFGVMSPQKPTDQSPTQNHTAIHQTTRRFHRFTQRRRLYMHIPPDNIRLYQSELLVVNGKTRQDKTRKEEITIQSQARQIDTWYLVGKMKAGQGYSLWGSVSDCPRRCWWPRA